MLLFGTGLIGLVGARIRKKKIGKITIDTIYKGRVIQLNLPFLFIPYVVNGQL